MRFFSFPFSFFLSFFSPARPKLAELRAILNARGDAMSVRSGGTSPGGVAPEYQQVQDSFSDSFREAERSARTSLPVELKLCLSVQSGSRQICSSDEKRRFKREEDKSR